MRIRKIAVNPLPCGEISGAAFIGTSWQIDAARFRGNTVHVNIGYSARARQFSDSFLYIHVLYIMLQVLMMLEDTAYLMQSSLKAEKEQ